MDRDATVHRNKTFRKKDIFTPGPLQNLGGLAIKYVGAGRPLQENKHCLCIDKHFNYYNQVIYQLPSHAPILTNYFLYDVCLLHFFSMKRTMRTLESFYSKVQKFLGAFHCKLLRLCSQTHASQLNISRKQSMFDSCYNALIPLSVMYILEVYFTTVITTIIYS